MTTAITSFDELKVAIAAVWPQISDSCAVCEDPDCLGFIYVMPEEEDDLLEADIQLVQLNGPSGPLFLDVYERDGDALVLGTKGPRCPYRGEDGRCQVHEDRPLNCHLYPLGLERDGNGGFVWGLHTECHYVRSLPPATLDATLDALRALVASIDPDVRLAYEASFRAADTVVSDASPVNRFITVAPTLDPA